jgi:nucleotide-binding universal stress UspA family protein
MFENVLAAVDDSERAATVLRAAAELAQRARGRLVALHVKPDDTANVDVSEEGIAAAERTSELRSHGTPAHYIIQQGSPEWQVLSTARRQRSDVIVVSPRPRRSWRRVMRSSLSTHLCSDASIPVLVVPCDVAGASPAPATSCFGELTSPVFITLDGSPASEVGLIWATALARILGRSLILLHVSGPLAPEADVIAIRAYLEGLREGLMSAFDTPIEVAVVRGSPVEEILAAAEARRAGAIVTTAYGASRRSMLLGGSVSLELRKRARWPVLYIPALAMEAGLPPDVAGARSTSEGTPHRIAEDAEGTLP